MDPKYIRNFSIIAHVDHGKSTLADGILSVTGALTKREEKAQYLDSMDLERERGITIKAQTVCIKYKSKDNQNYILNLIDTPGHVDFSYEVSRSLAACDGALLVVDAAQGVEAQTLANVYMALEHNLEIIPVLNKIDLPSANVEMVKNQIEDIIGIDAKDALCISAKEKIGISEVLEAVIKRIPPPKIDYSQDSLSALVFDSWFDIYQGVVILIRVFSGKINVGDKVIFMSNKKEYEILNLGIFTPHIKNLNQLCAGDVGFLISGIKDIRDIKVGDTITGFKNPISYPLPGFKKIKPMVFAGIFPIEESNYGNLKEALEKLCLNDSSLVFQPEKSTALGFGCRCGFLGLLHMEVVQERLEREFNLNLISTAPSVVYKILLKDGEKKEIDNPTELPEPGKIEYIQEPFVLLTIHTPSEYIGNILKICEERRGLQQRMEYISGNKVILDYKLPLNEMVIDFYDKLKSVSKGYASLEYEISDFEISDIVKLDILINGEKVDALSIMVHKSKSQSRGRLLVKKLKEIIPKQQYQVALQAAIGAKIISRENISALRKDVTAKCYGGDISRKRKLLEKQKEGKKRMKQIGKVSIPQEAFLAVLKVDE